MINIHKQLWAVKGAERKVTDSDFLLAYMSHREYTKTNEETQAFINRKSTGTNWAGNKRWDSEEKRYIKSDSPEELSFDNTPIKGFCIVGSVSRWSTSNKLIRVEDPRGFVVEIPTENLTTLLKHTIVDKGVVQEECVWGREGNNHILLPINSEVYKKACEQTQQNSEKITLTKLVIGQTIKFSVDDKEEFIYLGRGKPVWKLSVRQAKLKKEGWSYTRYKRDESDCVIGTDQVEDSKLGFIFKKKKPESEPNSWRYSYNWKYKISGKCVVTGVAENIPKVELFQEYLPDRMNKSGFDLCGTDGYGRYSTHEVIKINMKD